VPHPRRTDDEGPVRPARRLDQPRDAESAVGHGCRFHRAWYAEDDSVLYALSQRETREGARAFFQGQIDDEPGETATVLLGDIGLVPHP
jgi:hypothetical protein